MSNCRKLIFAMVFVGLFMPMTVEASVRYVAGKVHDSEGRPVVGASVLGRQDSVTAAGAPSDGEGRFLLKIKSPDIDSILVQVSSIGYSGGQEKVGLGPDTTRVDFRLERVLMEVGPIEVRPTQTADAPVAEFGSARVTREAQVSFVPTNPISAIKEPQVIREGSSHSSRLRVNGTSPTYFINGIEIGRNPNHYGMFSVIPASVVDNMTVRAHGTGARFDVPSAVEFETHKPFRSHADAEFSLSAIEGTGVWSLGSGRWFMTGALRKSVLDKLVNQFDVDSGRRTVPPTNFQDLFLSSGVRLGSSTHLVVDQYHVRDFLEYKTQGSSKNVLGANTALATSEHYVGGRIEMLRPGLLVKLRGAVRSTEEKYVAEPVQMARTQVEPILHLHASGVTGTVGVEAVLTMGSYELVVGDQVRYQMRQKVDLKQQNWNFLPPDAASDNPNIYQPELNQLYGTYHGTRRRTDHAAHASLRWSVGRVQLESGVRAGHYGALRHSEWITVRQLVTVPVGDDRRVSLFAGTFAEDPARRVLEPYQAMIHMDYSGLSPIRSGLVSVQFADGPAAVSVFRKRIDHLPVLTPDFGQIGSDGVAGEGFLRTVSSSQNDFYGADVSVGLDSLLGGRLEVESYYGYTHAVKTTSGVTVDYELNAPHRFLGKMRYGVSRVVSLGAELSVRSGYAYTPMPESVAAYGEDRYSPEYYKASLRAENTARFPVHGSLNLSAVFDFGETEVYCSIANITNRANPIINAADGYVYDAGILPSVGVTTRF